MRKSMTEGKKLHFWQCTCQLSL